MDKNWRWRVFLFFLLFLILFSLIIFIRLKIFPLEVLKISVEEQKIAGFVLAGEQKEGYFRYTVKTEIKNKGKIEKVKILLKTKTELEIGQKILIQGKLKEPENFSTDDGKIFDYRNFLLSRGVVATMDFPKIQIEENYKNISPILWFKREYIRASKIFEPITQSFILGITIGEKSFLPEKLQQAFKNTGLTHVVVLSGYNLSVIGAVFEKLFYFLPIFLSKISALGAVVFLALVSGFEPSSRRAVLMYLCVILRTNKGESSQDGQKISFYFLLLTFVALSLQNPLSLFFDPGFQLSFLATYGLITYANFFNLKLKRIFSFLRINSQIIRETLASTLSAYIFTLPLIIWLSGNVSLIAPLANILILPLIPITMLLGGLPIFLQMISSLGIFFQIPATIFSNLIATITIFLSNFPMLKISEGQFLPEILFFATIAFIYLGALQIFVPPYSNLDS